MKPARGVCQQQSRRPYVRPVVHELGDLRALTAQNVSYGNKEPGPHDANGYSPKKF